MSKEEAIECLRCIAWKFYKMGEGGGFFEDGATLYRIAQFIQSISKGE